jgi:hypothetical protein
MDGSASLIVPASVLRTAAEGRSCLQCRFHGKEGADVVCRRYPPQVTVLLVPAPPPRVGQFSPQPFSTYPPVQPSHPCGEWARATDT